MRTINEVLAEYSAAVAAELREYGEAEESGETNLEALAKEVCQRLELLNKQAQEQVARIEAFLGESK